MSSVHGANLGLAVIDVGHILIENESRFLQGWDPDNVMRPQEIGTDFPHQTLLPGLQFVLAGIVGKPDTFFTVPVVRFAFDIFSYV